MASATEGTEGLGAAAASTVVDAQAAYEALNTMLPAFLAGANPAWPADTLKSMNNLAAGYHAAGKLDRAKATGLVPGPELLEPITLAAARQSNNAYSQFANNY